MFFLGGKYLEIPYYSLRKLTRYGGQELLLSHDTWKFKSKEELTQFVESCFYEVGEFEYNKYNNKIQASANLFLDRGVYCDFIEDTYDYVNFWESEKKKILYGVIIDNGKKLYYYPGELYFWYNYLQIYNKGKLRNTFPEPSDVQHYMSLYENVAHLKNKHAAIVKKRQIASSYFHAAKVLRIVWFFPSAVVKVLTYTEAHMEQLWNIFEEYASQLNINTAWNRPMMPDKYKYWKQQIEVKENGIKTHKGLKSELIGRVMSESPTKGVGGPSTLVFYEEAGLAPNLKETFQYMDPALREGDILTGQFVAAGSVGELEHSRSLRDMILNPDNYNILSISNKYFDTTKVKKRSACFIPESWRYLPFVDEYGNSKVDEAEKHILAKREELKKSKDYETYNIMITQSPLSVEETFSYTKQSIFPVVLIRKELDRISSKRDYKCVELHRNEKGKIEAKDTNKMPIDKFPIPPNYSHKEGVLQIWEEPDTTLGFGSYIIGVDPVSDGQTITSNSLASVYVLKRATERTTYDKGGNVVENTLEPAKIVACWTGRYDDLDKTNEQILKIIEYYNAVAVIENNVNNCINYIIRNRKQHHLVKKNQIMFLKELNLNTTVMQEYGFRTTHEVKDNMIQYLIMFLKEEVGTEKIPGLNEERVIKGIECINDKMLLEEMLHYGAENTDRIIAASAAISYYYVVTSYSKYVKQYSIKKAESDEKGGLFNKNKQPSLNQIRKKMLFNKLK